MPLLATLLPLKLPITHLCDDVLRILRAAEVELGADVSQGDARVRKADHAHARLDHVVPQSARGKEWRVFGVGLPFGYTPIPQAQCVDGAHAHVHIWCVRAASRLNAR